MASVKLAPFAGVFLLAAFLMFPMKKVEAQDCLGGCAAISGWTCPGGCRCYPATPEFGGCAPEASSVDLKKMVDEHPNLCWSTAECTKKGTGNFCARFPNSDIEYGWCFASISEAEDAFFKTPTNPKFSKDFLKMLDIA